MNKPAFRRVAVVVVAAGKGLRAGGEVPKQFQKIGRFSVAEWTLRAFASHPAVYELILVAPADGSVPATPEAVGHQFSVVPGGETRDASVKAGLAAVPDTCTHVLIHDGARACVSNAVITRVIDALETSDGAAPGLAVTDALWRGTDGLVSGVQGRDDLFRAQTPQGFALRAIKAAHDAFSGAAADDVEVARAAGIEVAIVDGEAQNLKITGPEDFAKAAQILEAPMDIRTGNGFDVHRFGPGDHVMLCGLAIPHDRGLQGHSDADVGLHTITDAIYGALAEGDIGQHFPPTDPQWKGMASHVFLEHARDLAKTRGFTITHVDCTLICEHPKIGPHTLEMRDKLSEYLDISSDRISVKATTSERLGFTGRGEGIACLATVTLLKS